MGSLLNFLKVETIVVKVWQVLQANPICFLGFYSTPFLMLDYFYGANGGGFDLVCKMELPTTTYPFSK